VKLLPSRLEPIFVPRLWGTRNLDPFFPQRMPLEEAIGEVWLTGHDCRFAAGPLAGRTLREAWRAAPPEWAGRQARTEGAFPLLVKFIFPEDKLSIQVHPDDDYARQYEAEAGGAGKTEMWYAVAARPGAEVLVGLKPEVTPDSFGRAIVEARLEQCLERIALQTGDAIFVPAGTVHTIGPGSVLCEIQEHSDITYRIYDYGRRTAEGKPRPLHIEKALEVINFGEQSGGKLDPIRLVRGPVTETYLIACRYFAVEKWEFAERIAAVTSAEHFDLLIYLEGSGQLRARDEAVDYAAPQVWLLPATLGAYQLEPAARTTLLRTYVPDIFNEFVRRLADQGVAEAAWSRLVFP
jgi:mannose-6-phosphate isomerase